MRKLFLIATTLTLLVAASAINAQTKKSTDTKNPKTVTFSVPYEFNPSKYVCYKAPHKIHVDGQIYTPEWEAAPWTEYFVDIEGKNRPVTPRFPCRAKLLWDDQYLYIAAEMIEPHIWATLTQRESIIFHDNDFEVFLDITGTTHNYMEFEVNAFSTEWDLMIAKPYNFGGPPMNSWNMNGLKTAVNIYGTINDPSDTDDKWTFEMAIPLGSILEVRPRAIQDGDQWRLNFSRVEWQVDVKDGKYVKVPNTPEDNWVWSPIGEITIHKPEYWGFLQFSTKTAGTGSCEKDFVWNRNEDVKWALRQMLNRQREFRHQTGRWATTPAELKASEITLDGMKFEPIIYVTGDTFKISASGYNDTWWHIRSDSYVGQSK